MHPTHWCQMGNPGRGALKLKLKVLPSPSPDPGWFCYFKKKEGERFDSNGLEMGPAGCWGRVLAGEMFPREEAGVAAPGAAAAHRLRTWALRALGL